MSHHWGKGNSYDPALKETGLLCLDISGTIKMDSSTVTLSNIRQGMGVVERRGGVSTRWHGHEDLCVPHTHTHTPHLWHPGRDMHAPITGRQRR